MKMCKNRYFLIFYTIFLPISSLFFTQNALLSKEMLVMGALSYLYNHFFPIGTVLAYLDAYKGRYVQKTDIFSWFSTKISQFWISAVEISKNGGIWKKSLVLLFPHQMAPKKR